MTRRVFAIADAVLLFGKEFILLLNKTGGGAILYFLTIALAVTGLAIAVDQPFLKFYGAAMVGTLAFWLLLYSRRNGHRIGMWLAIVALGLTMGFYAYMIVDIY